MVDDVGKSNTVYSHLNRVYRRGRHVSGMWVADRCYLCYKANLKGGTVGVRLQAIKYLLKTSEQPYNI